jgi:hypothetical protein
VNRGTPIVDFKGSDEVCSHAGDSVSHHPIVLRTNLAVRVVEQSDEPRRREV